MNLPALAFPQLYQGLYVFDFGDHVAVGYTVEEIEILLGAPEHKHGRAFKIHHASADGQLALRGLSKVDSQVTEAMQFYRREDSSARRDFERLQQAAALKPPPTTLHWHLVSDPPAEWPFFSIMLYRADWSDMVGRWLQVIGFEGGDLVEGGVNLAREYPSSNAKCLEQLTIEPDERYHSRPRAEVLAAIDRPIQRDLRSE